MTHRFIIVVTSFMMLVSAPVKGLDGKVALSQYTRTSWTERDGLPSSVIWAIAQDSDGYLWLGTNDGLIRFDGVRFTRWDAIARSTKLSDSTVRALCIAHDGSLWMGFAGAGGVSRWKNGRMSYYSSKDGVPEGAIATLFEDREGTIWAGGHGLSRFRNAAWERLGMSRSFSPNTAVYGLFEDQHGNLWVGSSGGISRRPFGADTFQSWAPTETARAFAEDFNGDIWITGPQQAFGILRSHYETGRRDESPRAPNGRQLLRDKAGNIWSGTQGEGLWRIQVQPGTTRRTAERYPAGKLTSEVVRSMLEDREGNLWVGTQNGLNRLSENQFARRPGGLPLSARVRVVTSATDGSIWIGTDNGLYRSAGSELHLYDRRSGLPSLMINALHGNRRGTLWVATEQGGFGQLDRRRFPELPMQWNNSLKRIIALTVDSDEAVWLSDVDRGVFRWKDGQLVSLEHVPEIGPKVARLAHADQKGRIWLAFVDGSLVVYEAGRFRMLSANDGIVGSVTALHDDTHGTLWIGTSRGIGRFDGRRLFIVGANNGLPITGTTAIMDDDDGDLWIGGNAGLVRFSQAEFDRAIVDSTYQMHYAFYDVDDGLPGVPNYLGSVSTARSGDGTLWFVTSDGVAVVQPRTLAKVPTAPAVRIDDVVVDDHQMQPLSKLELPSRTAKMEISYTALTLTASGKVRFRYRLEGFDAGWVDAGRRRQAFYTNLPPGQYRFRVGATNGGSWTDPDGVLDFSITPAFYQTAWFYAAWVFMAMFAVWTAWQIRLRHVRHEFSLVLSERTRMGREIHDTLLQSLVGVALQFDELSSEVESAPRSAMKHLERLRTQVEMYIRETRHSIWNLRSPSLERRELAAAHQDAAESMVSSKALRLDFAVNGTSRRCEAQVEEELLRIGHEAISNAIRHAHASALTVELCYEDNAVRLRVQDNGRGFDPHDVAGRVGDHCGLASMRERADHIHGHLTIETAAGHGASVQVIAPLAAPKTWVTSIRRWRPAFSRGSIPRVG